MKNWFESKVTYLRTLDDGYVKRVTESYLMDAMSFTEAEARTIEMIKPYVSGEGEIIIVAIKRCNISELFLSENCERFFKAKIQFIIEGEKGGKEKKVNEYMIIQADVIDEAQEIIKDKMKDTTSDYVIAEIKETQIVDVFLYNTGEDEESSN